MSDEQKPTLTAEEAYDAIMDMVPQFMQHAGDGDLDGIEGFLDQLGGIVADTGLDPSRLDLDISGIKRESAKARRHSANTDAAMWAGDMERAEMLNTKGPDLDYDALGTSASIPSKEELARLYEEAGLDPDVMNEAPDHVPDAYANIAAGTPGAVAAFIASGNNPNVPQGDNRHTAFLAALDAPRRNLADLKALVAAGADPCLTHAWGDTALNWAMCYHHQDTVTRESEIEIVAFLVTQGLDINAPVDNFGCVFRLALIMGGPDQVAAVLAAGADPTPHLPKRFSSEFLAGATPLIAAAPKPETVALLLAAGADPQAIDGQGRNTTTFIREMSAAARARAEPSDPWTGTHAKALEKTCSILDTGAA